MVKEWLYFGKGDVIESIEGGIEGYDVEVWKDLCVIEISSAGTSIDMELIPEKRIDEFCMEYMTTNGFDCIYQVTLGKDTDSFAEDAMKKICENNGGRFCGDTEDLTPVITCL